MLAAKITSVSVNPPLERRREEARISDLERISTYTEMFLP